MLKFTLIYCDSRGRYRIYGEGELIIKECARSARENFATTPFFQNHALNSLQTGQTARGVKISASVDLQTGFFQCDYVAKCMSDPSYFEERGG